MNDPHGDLWPAPHPDGPVHATVRLPGSKSITNRALVLAALSDGPSVVRQALRSRDTAADGRRADRARRRRRHHRRRLEGHARTAARPGDPRLRAGRHGDALRAAGRRAGRRAGGLRRRPARPAAPDGRDPPGAARTSASTSRTRTAARCRSRSSAPAAVRGGEVTIDASASSQFVSALLLAGARYDEGVDVRHDGKPVPSLPHIDMTVEQLRLHGVDVDDSDAEPLAGPARPRSARSTYSWSRTCPTPRRSWRPRWSPAAA